MSVQLGGQPRSARLLATDTGVVLLRRTAQARRQATAS